MFRCFFAVKLIPSPTVTLGHKSQTPYQNDVTSLQPLPRFKKAVITACMNKSVRLEVIAKLHFHAPRFFRDIAHIARPATESLFCEPQIVRCRQTTSAGNDVIGAGVVGGAVSSARGATSTPASRQRRQTLQFTQG